MMKRLLLRLLLSLALLGSIPAQAQLVPSGTTATLSLTSGSCPGTGCLVVNSQGMASAAVQITGTWAGTISFEGSNDNSNWVALPNASSPSTVANGVFPLSMSGVKYLRVRFSTYSSGTAVVTVTTALSGGGSGGGGGTGSVVNIADPSISSQKAAVNASGQLSITCANCSGSGASAVDNSAFTAGATSGAPAMGFYHSTIDTVTDGRAATLAMDSKRNLFNVIRDAAGNARGVNVTAGNALTVDASATTQPVSGTFWQATQPTSVANGSNVALGSTTDAKATATDVTAVTAISLLKEISFMEQTPASRAVTNAGTFATQAAQSGTWNTRTQDGAGNALTTNSSTFTAKFALDTNLLGTLGTAFTTAGKVDVKGADGDVFVRQATAANLNTQAAQVASVPTTVTLQSAATGNANGTVLSVNGMAMAGLTVNCATCSGGTTVNFEISEDASNFVSVSAQQVGTTTLAATTTTAGITEWQVPVAGFQQLRARVSAYSAGTITVTGRSLPVGAPTMVPVQAVQATAANLNATVVQATGSNLHITCDSGCSSSSAPADASAFTASSTSQTPVGGFFQTTATNNALTTGQMGAFQVTANRALFSNLRNAAGTEVGTSTTPLQVTLANTGANATAVKVDGSAVTQPVSLSGNQAVNVAQWNGSAVASPDANSYPIVTRAPTATTTAAASACNILSAASTNSTACKGSGGNLYGFDIYNTTTTVYYLRLYNASGAPTCSSSTGFIRTIPIPPAASAGLVGGIVSNQIDGVNYSSGIGYCITGGSSSTDNTNAATGVFGEIRYK